MTLVSLAFGNSLSSRLGEELELPLAAHPASTSPARSRPAAQGGDAEERIGHDAQRRAGPRSTLVPEETRPAISHGFVVKSGLEDGVRHRPVYHCPARWGYRDRLRALAVLCCGCLAEFGRI